MKKYVRPELLVEDFTLSQSVAAGKCVRDVQTDKSKYPAATIVCFSGNTDANVFYVSKTNGGPCEMVATSGDYGSPAQDYVFDSWSNAKEEMYDYIINGDTVMDHLVDEAGRDTYAVDNDLTYYAWTTEGKHGTTVHVGPISIEVLRTNSY